MNGSYEAFTPGRLLLDRDEGKRKFGAAILCPLCREIGIEKGGTGDGITVHQDRDEYDSPAGTRGEYVQIDMECAAGHPFALFVGNHKGTAIIQVMVNRELMESNRLLASVRPSASDDPFDDGEEWAR